MTDDKTNSCAQCGVPIKPGLALCNVCANVAISNSLHLRYQEGTQFTC